MAEDLKDSLALQIPPLSLAYVGDSIYDFFVRDRLIRDFSGSLNKINSKKKDLVCAKAQSDVRARNHKSQSRSKNSGIGDYRRATGFEAVLGYLHYQNKEERLKVLMETGLSFLLEREEGK